MSNIIQSLLNRQNSLFQTDLQEHENDIVNIINHSSFLVLGGAGTIGQAVVKEIFKRNPKRLHVVDLSENNLAELVRDLRSSLGYIKGEFSTFVVDIGSVEFQLLLDSQQPYDYILNLSALKHVRSEKDVFSLLRMINVNIFNTHNCLTRFEKDNVKKYFADSTDKATNPVNLMGATKLIMEDLIFGSHVTYDVSSARFANVAFSDGSLLYGFRNRLEKRQPIVIPDNIERYFVTQQEAGELCLMSCLLGDNREIFFPKQTTDFKLLGFKPLLEKFLQQYDMQPLYCQTETEARDYNAYDRDKSYWPCFISKTDTTGEKPFEEFYSSDEETNFERFSTLGVIQKGQNCNQEKFDEFRSNIKSLIASGELNKQRVIEAIKILVPSLDHIEVNKSLDDKM